MALRAPEVLVGAPWGPMTDLWNLGAVVLEVFRAVRLFSGRRSVDATSGAAAAAAATAAAAAESASSAPAAAAAAAAAGSWRGDDDGAQSQGSAVAAATAATAAPAPAAAAAAATLGPYERRQHVREIVHHFGPFPRRLLERGDTRTVRDVIGFDLATGCVRGAPPLGAPPLKSDAYMADLAAEPRAHFVGFMRALMVVDPDARRETMELLAEPWLDAVAS